MTFHSRAPGQKPEAPFKYINDNDPDDHGAAAEGYIRALRAGNVTGLPHFLVQVSMPMVDFIDYLASGDIVIYAETETVAFRKAPVTQNFPNIVAAGTELTEEERRFVLEQVYAQKPWLRNDATPL